MRGLRARDGELSAGDVAGEGGVLVEMGEVFGEVMVLSLGDKVLEGLFIEKGGVNGIIRGCGSEEDGVSDHRGFFLGGGC